MLNKHLDDSINTQALKTLECFLENSSDGIAVINSKGIIEEYNQKFLKLFAIQEKDVVGTDINKILKGIKVTNLKDPQIYKIAKKNNVIIKSKDIFLKNGSLKILFISKHEESINDMDFFIGKNFKYIFDTMNEGVYIANSSGNLCYINPAAEKQEGYSLNSILGKHLTEVYPVNETNSPMLQVLKKGTPIINFHINYIVNGKQIYQIGNALPLKLNEKIVGAIAIVQDVTNLKEMIENNIDLQKKNTNNKNLSNNLENGKIKANYTFSEIVGDNILFVECKKSAQNAAKTDSPFLLFGETGTGKELFAQSIHSASKRENDTFLAINCAAIPETLLEGILFGTTKGVYTGAIDRPGLLEQANGGTLFLDEINSMPLNLQSKLLRVLEEKCVQRLGSKDNININARIISSCNIEPSDAIEKKQLRDDLFYRLAVLYIVIPPLRERKSDIELLTSHFINYFSIKYNKNIKGIHEEIFSNFINYQWPGNVRQLKHCIECAMNLADSNSTLIEAKHIPKYLKMFSTKASENNMENYNVILNAATENYNLFREIQDEEKNIIEILKKNKGNITKSAKDLGLSRTQIMYRLKKYNLNN